MNIELSSANHTSAELRTRLDDVEGRLRKLMGSEEVLSLMSLDECNDLEKLLKSSLQAVEARKVG